MQTVYFIVGFVAILLAFIFFIVFLSRKLSGNVSQRVYGLIEKITIAGILLGIVGTSCFSETLSDWERGL
jgi:hypothetical protein